MLAVLVMGFIYRADSTASGLITERSASQRVFDTISVSRADAFNSIMVLSSINLNRALDVREIHHTYLAGKFNRPQSMESLEFPEIRACYQVKQKVINTFKQEFIKLWQSDSGLFPDFDYSSFHFKHQIFALDENDFDVDIDFDCNTFTCSKGGCDNGQGFWVIIHVNPDKNPLVEISGEGKVIRKRVIPPEYNQLELYVPSRIFYLVYLAGQIRKAMQFGTLDLGDYENSYKTRTGSDAAFSVKKCVGANSGGVCPIPNSSYNSLLSATSLDQSCNQLLTSYSPTLIESQLKSAYIVPLFNEICADFQRYENDDGISIVAPRSSGSSDACRAISSSWSIAHAGALIWQCAGDCNSEQRIYCGTTQYFSNYGESTQIAIEDAPQNGRVKSRYMFSFDIWADNNAQVDPYDGNLDTFVETTQNLMQPILSQYNESEDFKNMFSKACENSESIFQCT